MYEYEDMKRTTYDCGDNVGIASFVPVCSKCFRFVKADKTIKVNEMNGLSKDDNATCSRCGRTKMLFEGFF